MNNKLTTMLRVAVAATSVLFILGCGDNDS